MIITPISEHWLSESHRVIEGEVSFHFSAFAKSVMQVIAVLAGWATVALLLAPYWVGRI